MLSETEVRTATLEAWQRAGVAKAGHQVAALQIGVAGILEGVKTRGAGGVVPERQVSQACLLRITCESEARSGLFIAGRQLAIHFHGLEGGGCRRVFAPGSLERARLVKTLLKKGVPVGRLAASGLAFDAGQAYVVYDGQELRACPDAAAAIGTVVRARRWCSAVDLATIRRGTAATESSR